ncbi:prepilin-type N-terminal cleavage/methylation domain-containing protein [Simiduia sp. 21SJ11W-1]|uniref:prepilin-type N-terminal cleavage/methylation domain-containing protein n=1 Tax=Simiduia sp. 21SJ11W-1 TaxID=2909669 RepID=UPI00273A64CA|nr:prepilin-type N-terminal cleavage/methylation domain-containing protein [Simiduia sp. 21SJ11W-1]
MKKAQSGFTLIELIAVIVILGILAATAVPKFINLQDDASFAAMKGIAGAVASSSDLNAAAARVKAAGVSAGTTTIVDTSAGCTVAVVNSLMRDAIANLVAADTTATGEYVISETTAFPGTPTIGDTAVCTLTLDATTNTVNFSLVYATP